jgi:hypothetical protein
MNETLDGLRILATAVRDAFNYGYRMVGKVFPSGNNGIGVSTCLTSDCGYETALLDGTGTHPVERYSDRDAAEAGHQKWVVFAKEATGKSITKLGYPGLVENEIIVLVKRV